MFSSATFILVTYNNAFNLYYVDKFKIQMWKRNFMCIPIAVLHGNSFFSNARVLFNESDNICKLCIHSFLSFSSFKLH